MSKRDELVLEKDTILLEPDYYDEAILGVTAQGQVVYSLNKLIDVLVSHDGMTEEGAIEYIDYNICNLYVGDKSPVVLTTELYDYK